MSGAALAEPRRHRAQTGLAAKALTQLPDRLIVLFLCAVLAAGSLATFDQFRPVLVLPLFVVLAAATWRLVPQPAPKAGGAASTGAASTGASSTGAAATGASSTGAAATGASSTGALGAALALLIGLGWIAFNVVFRSELYIVVRDPAIYTLRSLWLVHHTSPNVAVGHALQGGRGVPGVFTDSAGFPTVGSSWQAQGTSLVPALVATFGWVAGTQGVLSGNIIIGAVGLLAVYALARRLLGSLWALVPMLALATSMPMVAFSRAPYTEPTALVLGVGGLVLMWISIQTRRAAVALLAGISIGATFLARPDGLLFVIGGVCALGLLAVLARSAEVRAGHRTRLLSFIAGAALSTALALIDLARNSSVYEAGNFASIKSLLEVAVAAAVVLPALSFVPADGGVRAALASHRIRAAQVSVVVLALAFAAMALRPLYYTAHTSGSSNSIKAGIATIANRQRAEGLAVDGTRTYDEQSVTWLSWYFSWPVVVMAAAGVCIGAASAWRRRDGRLIAVLSVLGVAAALYLNKVQITPDQIWAMRRFLPIIVPGGLILAALVPLAIWQAWPRARPVAVVVAAVMVLAPLSTWRRTLITREYGGAKAFTAALCNSVQGSDVIIADAGSGGTIFLPTLRIACGVTAVLVVTPTPAALKTVRANWADGKPVTVIAFIPQPVPWRVTPTEPYDTGIFNVWTEPLSSRPVHVTKTGDQLWVGSLATDGLVDARRPA